MQSVDDTYDVYDETSTLARIDHRCDACGEVIPAGTRYVRLGYGRDRCSDLACPVVRATADSGTDSNTNKPADSSTADSGASR